MSVEVTLRFLRLLVNHCRRPPEARAVVEQEVLGNEARGERLFHYSAHTCAHSIQASTQTYDEIATGM